MYRRTFLQNTFMGIISLGLPLSLSGNNLSSGLKPGIKDKGLKLSFKPYDLNLRHACNLAKSSRTHTTDVLVQIEID